MMQDERVADGVRQATQGNVAVDNMTRGRRWRTCNNAKGGGNDDGGDYEDQSLQWQNKLQ